MDVENDKDVEIIKKALGKSFPQYSFQVFIRERIRVNGYVESRAINYSYLTTVTCWVSIMLGFSGERTCQIIDNYIGLNINIAKSVVAKSVVAKSIPKKVKKDL